VGVVRNKHQETTYKCCTSDADGIISVPCQINQKTVIIRKSQCCAQYLCGIKHKTCFFIKLDHFALKDDNNHFCSMMVRKWIDGTFKFWYFAQYAVNLILVQKG